MRKLLAYFLVGVICSILFTPHNVHAAGFTYQDGTILGSDKDKNKSTFYVTKGDSLTYQAFGLAANNYYRIEMGWGDSNNDAILQHNIDTSRGADSCYPADFGTAEKNINTEYSKVNSCNKAAVTLDYILNGTLNIPRLLSNYGTLDGFHLYLKRGKGGDDNETLAKANVALVEKPIMTLDPTTGKVTRGEKLFVSIENLLPNSPYTVTVRDWSGKNIYHTLSFTTGRYGEKCTPANNGDTFYSGSRGKGTLCDAKDYGFNYYLNIDTSGYDCNIPGFTGVGTCTIFLSNSKKDITYKEFSLDTSAFTAVMTPSESVIPEDIPTGGDPQVAINFYETTDTEIKAVACAQSKVKFEWWQGTQANCNAQGVCSPLGSTTGDKEVNTDGGVATFKTTFSTNGSSDIGVLRATCGTQVAPLIPYRVFGKGEEFMNVPKTIAPDTAWEVTVGGLDDEVNKKLDTNYKACYYIEIYKISDEGEKASIVENGTLECSTDDSSETTKTHAVAASTSWYPSAKVSMPALPAGNYEARLALTIWAGEDSGKATKPFCVGTGSTCVNETTEIQVAPEPPCAQYDAATGQCIQINSALGILSIDIPKFTKTIFSVLLSISGAIILLVVIRSGYLMIFSQGNAEKIKEAQDRLTSAVIGFLFLIFSLVILQTIGVDILHIPGFS